MMMIINKNRTRPLQEQHKHYLISPCSYFLEIVERLINKIVNLHYSRRCKCSVQEFYKMSAVMVLMEYLTDTAVAPLQRDFVEVPDPYCSKVRRWFHGHHTVMISTVLQSSLRSALLNQHLILYLLNTSCFKENRLNIRKTKRLWAGQRLGWYIWGSFH